MTENGCTGFGVSFSGNADEAKMFIVAIGGFILLPDGVDVGSGQGIGGTVVIGKVGAGI